MNRFFIGFAFGVLLASAIVAFVVVPQVRKNYRAVGFNDGQIAARAEIADMVSKLLGTDLSPTESRQVLLEVKSTSVVVVDRNGTKTLRTIR